MKRIKIKLLLILLLWFTSISIKMSENDLKIFEKRNLWLEKHLKKLGGSINDK